MSPKQRHEFYLNVERGQDTVNYRVHLSMFFKWWRKYPSNSKEQTNWNIYILIGFDCMYFCPNGNSNERQILKALFKPGSSIFIDASRISPSLIVINLLISFKIQISVTQIRRSKSWLPWEKKYSSEKKTKRIIIVTNWRWLW